MKILLILFNMITSLKYLKLVEGIETFCVFLLELVTVNC